MCREAETLPIFARFAGWRAGTRTTCLMAHAAPSALLSWICTLAASSASIRITCERSAKQGRSGVVYSIRLCCQPLPGTIHVRYNEVRTDDRCQFIRECSRLVLAMPFERLMNP